MATATNSTISATAAAASITAAVTITNRLSGQELTTLEDYKKKSQMPLNLLFFIPYNDCV
jgi:hypothetical protein